jgi:hypothetical protein
MLGNVGHIKGRLRAVDVKGRKMRVSLILSASLQAVFVGNEQAEDIRRVASYFVLCGLQMEASLSLIGSEFETVSMYLLQSLLGDCNVSWWSHLSTSWRS